jgi:hypothetical protein
LSVHDVTGNAEMEMNGKVIGALHTCMATAQTGHELQVSIKAYDLSGNVMEASQTLD